jgi:hypothetical protein
VQKTRGASGKRGNPNGSSRYQGEQTLVRVSLPSHAKFQSNAAQTQRARPIRWSRPVFCPSAFRLGRFLQVSGNTSQFPLARGLRFGSENRRPTIPTAISAPSDHSALTRRGDPPCSARLTQRFRAATGWTFDHPARFQLAHVPPPNNLQDVAAFPLVRRPREIIGFS